jgi:hypothetical protein
MVQKYCDWKNQMCKRGPICTNFKEKCMAQNRDIFCTMLEQYVTEKKPVRGSYIEGNIFADMLTMLTAILPFFTYGHNSIRVSPYPNRYLYYIC